MAKNAKHRLKLLKVYEYLKMHSDEDHPKSVQDIIDALESQDIDSERRSIYKDIEILSQNGYDIAEAGYYKYYLKKRELNLGQIRFLMDVAQSAYFLPEKQTEKLCAALESLASVYRAELVRDQVIVFDKVKRNNEDVLNIVEKINNAIEKDCKISFRYFHTGFGGKRIYKENGARFFVNPAGLVFNDGRYYFIAYDDGGAEIRPRRVDRMCDVEIETGMPKIRSDAESRFFFGDLKDRMSAFGMWTSDAEKVTFVVENSYIEDIYEKFGDKINTDYYDKNHFTFTEKVNLSDVFFGWCASYGTHIKILSPQSVKDTFVRKLQDSLSLYPDEASNLQKNNQSNK